MMTPSPRWPNPSVTLDELPVAYIEIDALGFIRYANQAAFRLHELPAKELLGREIWDLLPPDETERSRAAFFRTMETGEEPAVVRRSLFNSQGEYRVQEFHRRLLRDAEGRPAGISSVIFDVSQLEAASQRPAFRAQWLESILTSLPPAIVVTDTLGQIGYLNPAAEQLTGWLAGELAGRPIETILPPPESGDAEGANLAVFRHSFAKAMESSCTYRFHLQPRTGPLFEVEVTASAVLDNETGYASGLLLFLAPGSEGS